MDFEEYKNCKLCPRKCGVNRYESVGYCKCSAELLVSSICIHKGEEPVIGGKTGICNIFLSHCNLQCIFCQNYQISNNVISGNVVSIDDVVRQVAEILDNGVSAVGFVSPAHFLPHIKAVIRQLKIRGYSPVFIYNTNSYENIEELQKLEGFINVYLPDFKYYNSETAHQYSDAGNYPEIAKMAIKEMYRQKGSSLIMDEETNLLQSGLIIRHLVLPGHIDESIKILQYIADEISTSVAISLMSQYWVTPRVENHKNLGRELLPIEYHQVVNEFENLGFRKGWLQDIESKNTYKPDFSLKNPFEF